jgi:hypothetical protein
MQWRVRLERTRPIAVRCAETEIETLYEALVRAQAAAGELGKSDGAGTATESLSGKWPG